MTRGGLFVAGLGALLGATAKPDAVVGPKQVRCYSQTASLIDRGLPLAVNWQGRIIEARAFRAKHEPEWLEALREVAETRKVGAA